VRAGAGRGGGARRARVGVFQVAILRKRFADDERIEPVAHDLDEPLPALGLFGASTLLCPRQSADLTHAA
jgi:hypothetical protein